MLVALPPALIFGYLRFPGVQTFVNGLLPQAFAVLLGANEALLFFVAVSWSYPFVAAYGFVQNCAKPKEEIDASGLLALFETLERVVAAKASRFEDAAKVPGEKQAATLFLEITKPDQQIALLGEGLYGFFDSLETEIRFKVSIAVIEGGGPVEWLWYAPGSDPPRTSLSMLQRPESAICRALKKRDLVIVEDLVKECQKPPKKKRYVVENEEECSEGSLLCYPLLKGRSGQIPLVITVVANRKAYFSPKKSELYLWILKRFDIRMQLEAHLQDLRKQVVQNGQSDDQPTNQAEPDHGRT